MTPGPAVAPHRDTQRRFFYQVLQGVRRIMVESYGMRQVTIRSVSSEGARLSIPIKVTGLDAEGGQVRYFGKIMGNSDLMSAHTIQMFKNLYLRMNAAEPIFGVSESVEDMVRAQYEGLLALHRIGIPTVKPYGFHLIEGGLWLLVLDYLDARPITKVKRLDLEQVDTAFHHLRTMHSKRIYHGDIKPDNILVDVKVYILDIGQFSKHVPAERKRAYDLASMVCSFLDHLPVEEIVRVAGKHASRRQLRAAADFVELVQRRPDFDFDDEKRDELVRLLRGERDARDGRT